MIIVSTPTGREAIDGEFWSIDNGILSITKNNVTIASFIHWDYICKSDSLKN